MKELEVSKIKNIIENNIIDENILKTINIILISINDWPDKILTLDEFVNKIEKFMDGSSTKSVILNVLNKIDYKINAWESESLFELLEVFDYQDDKRTIKEIVDNIKIHLHCLQTNL